MTAYKPGTSLPERDPTLRIKLDQIDKAIDKTNKDFFKANDALSKSLDQVESQISEVIQAHQGRVKYWEERCESNIEKLFKYMDAIHGEIQRADDRDLKRWEQYLNHQERNRKKEAQRVADLPTPTDQTLLKKASTICIFDSLLFAIENWSSDGQVASDVSLCSQSILFPLVYEPVMSGDEDYYLETFPVVSLEIVRRGREFVKWLRETSHSSLADKDSWDAYSDVVRGWWINDALPLIYGARSDDWVLSSAYDLEKMVKWRDLPASRALDFPLIFDGMELMSKQMDNIRKPTGLPEFTRNQMQTRIEL